MYKNYYYEIDLNSNNIDLQIEVIFKINILISDIYPTKL